MIELFPEPGPRLFNAPAGRPFAEDFAKGVLARVRAAGGDPLDLADILVVVSTRRAMRALRRAFADMAGGAALGPRMASLGDLDEMADLDRLEVGADTAPDPDPPAVSSLSRLLFLTDLVRALLRSAPELGAPSAAPALARDLAALLDSAQAAGLSLDAFEGVLDDEKHAAHWALSARFLDIVRQAWPARLDELGRIDPWERRRRAVARLADRWAEAPPRRPVIVAGSTGSMDASSWFIDLVGRLPQGAIVLPGLDAEMDDASAAAALQAPEHPQYGLLRLVQRLGADRRAAKAWVDVDEAAPAARKKLLSEAMRPAPVTDVWRAELATLRAQAPAATERLTLLEAPTRREEAAAIAVALRQALETPGRTAALVTPDRTLARQVTAELARWGVSPDDSSGRPLGLTPPGVFFRAVLDAAMSDLSPAALLALLKHPLCAAGFDRGVSARRARRFERDALRAQKGPALGEAHLRARAAAAVEGRDAPEDGPDLPIWFEAVLDALAPLRAAVANGEAPLATWLGAHRTAAERLAATDEAATGELYRRAAGETLLGFLDKLAAEAGASPDAIDGADYAALLGQLIGAEQVREPYGRHARIKILGPLEARMLSADLAIVAGLNEGVWPKTPEPDAWISRDMRAAVGLPPLESRIGLSAHDFFQAAMAPEVILARSQKMDGAPTTPSRWLIRLENLLKGADPASLQAMRDRAAPLLSWARALDAPLDRPPAPRPRPTPPVDARPTEFSATDVEKLIRDPYSIYAKRVLYLRPSFDLPDAPDARARGELLHKLVEELTRKTMSGWPEPEEAARLFDETADEVFAEIADHPSQHAFWRARADRFKAWFLRSEGERRETGRPVALEASAAIEFETALGDAVLRATADRIDLISEEVGAGYAVYDYKSGSAPSDRQVAQFAKQLPLEAAMLARGEFQNRRSGDRAPAGAVRKLAYITFSSGGAERALKGEAEVLGEEALDGLRRLISAYANEKLGYQSRMRPTFIRFEGHYDHLARYGEWSDGAEEDRA